MNEIQIYLIFIGLDIKIQLNNFTVALSKAVFLSSI